MAKNCDQTSKCSINFKYTAESESRATVLYNSLRVDSEPGNVIRKLSVNGNVLSVDLESANVSNLRASVNGILENIKTLTDVISAFEITKEYSYDYL